MSRKICFCCREFLEDCRCPPDDDVAEGDSFNDDGCAGDRVPWPLRSGGPPLVPIDGEDDCEDTPCED